MLWGCYNSNVISCFELLGEQWFNGSVLEKTSSETGEVRINEAYRDYAPPVNASKIVRQLLSSVPDKYLRGLDCVVLTNATALSRRGRIGRIWSRGRKFDKSGVLGLYHHRKRSNNSTPYIELRVDRIVASFKGAPLWIPPIRDLVFGHVLFHELGHHIHDTIRPEYVEKEDVADSWGKKLSGEFIRKKYWYAMPIIVPVMKVYKFMRRRHWI